MQQEIKKDALILKETINGNEIVWTIKATFGGLKVKWENKTEGRKSEEYYKWYWSWGTNQKNEKQITFYSHITAKRLPEIIRKICKVINETDSMTDYFEDDKFYLEKNHPLFKIAAEAIIIIYERYKLKTEKQIKFPEDYRKQHLERYQNTIDEIKFYLLTNSLWE